MVEAVRRSRACQLLTTNAWPRLSRASRCCAVCAEVVHPERYATFSPLFRNF